MQSDPWVPLYQTFWQLLILTCKFLHNLPHKEAITFMNVIEMVARAC